MAKKAFHLGDVLSITTGRLVSPRHMEGVYDILNWMTGDSLFTHQLPRAGRECAPWLLRQHPQLADIAEPELTPEECDGWLAEQVAKYGESLEVSPIPADDHERIDPITEAERMMGKDRVIVVNPEPLP